MNKDDVVQALRKARENGIRRLVIVGGSPAYHVEIKKMADQTGVEIRLVEGNSTKARSAVADVSWADRVLIWPGSIILHQISKAYRLDKSKVRFVTSRGLSALAEVLR